MEIALILFVIAGIFVARSIKVVPQQNAWVKERLGKYAGTLTPGLNFLVPFIDRVAYKHSLKEIPLDVPSQVCITRDNTQLQVDGILYFQVTDPMRASYGSSNYIMAVTQLAQTSPAQRDRPAGTRQDVRGTRHDQRPGRGRHRRGRPQLGREGAALRDQGPDPARRNPARHAAADHRRTREARPHRRIGGPPPGADQHRHRRARGLHRPLRGEKQAQINNAQGEAASITAVAEATAQAIERVAAAIRQPGGEQAVQLKVAERAVDAYSRVAADATTTLVVPSNMTEVSTLIASAMKMVQGTQRP